MYRPAITCNAVRIDEEWYSERRGAKPRATASRKRQTFHKAWIHKSFRLPERKQGDLWTQACWKSVASLYKYIWLILHQDNKAKDKQWEKERRKDRAWLSGNALAYYVGFMILISWLNEMNILTCMPAVSLRRDWTARTGPAHLIGRRLPRVHSS